MLFDEEQFREYLSRKSLKQTTERIDIAKAVASFDDTFTIDELQDCITDLGWPVSKATLYRTMPILIESGMIKPIATHQLNNHTFKRCEVTKGVSFFSCGKCNTPINVNDDFIQDLYDRLTEKYELDEIIDNLLMLKGICPECVNISYTKQTSRERKGIDNLNVRIILLEDEDILRSLIVKFLKGQGYEVFAFKNPLEFNIDCMCNDNESIICSDLLITDIKMPNMDGIEFIERQLEKNCRIKHIAFISAYWTLEQLDFAGNIGAAIFHKPFNILELKDWIEKCISEIPENRMLGEEFVKEDSA